MFNKFHWRESLGERAQRRGQGPDFLPQMCDPWQIHQNLGISVYSGVCRVSARPSAKYKCLLSSLLDLHHDHCKLIFIFRQQWTKLNMNILLWWIQQKTITSVHVVGVNIIENPTHQDLSDCGGLKNQLLENALRDWHGESAQTASSRGSRPEGTQTDVQALAGHPGCSRAAALPTRLEWFCCCF